MSIYRFTLKPTILYGSGSTEEEAWEDASSCLQPWELSYSECVDEDEEHPNNERQFETVEPSND
jgi:hypothetical protein